jgi:hypothetical protein
MNRIARLAAIAVRAKLRITWDYRWVCVYVLGVPVFWGITGLRVRAWWVLPEDDGEGRAG